MATSKKDAVALRSIQGLIVEVRGQQVILDHDLAAIYDVETRTLNQAVKRNIDRSPKNFAFSLKQQEVVALRSQFVISKSGEKLTSPAASGRGGSRYLPFAFTEHGALMAANVLRSPKAVEMSVFIVRAFVKMREEFSSRRDLEKRLNNIEKVLLVHDTQLKELFDKIRPLLLPPADPPRKGIGFNTRN